MRRPFAGLIAATLICSLLPALLGAKKKKKDEEEITQTLEVLPDPPSTIKAETARLTFHVSPLTSKGLLSQQVRDAIKNLWRLNSGEQIVKLRAFVAGTGDMRRFQSIVSEMFTEKKQALPVISVIQVGGLPMEAAQVIVEATSLAKKPVNPNGLAFISGQAATAELKSDQPHLKVAPLATESLNKLRKVFEGLSLTSKDALRVSCFASSLEDYAEVHRMVSTEYPQAAINIVQTQRSAANAVVECEAVARLTKAPSQPVEFVNPPGIEKSANYSQAALVNAPRVLFSGSQLAFRAQEADVRLAFERLKSSVEHGGASLKTTVMSSVYPLSRSVSDKVRGIRFEFYDKANPPASTLLPFEGLPSLDASFAVDVVAIPQ